MLPLYEAKMLHLYDTRWATYEDDGSSRLMTAAEKADQEAPMPRYWVPEHEVEKRLGGRWSHQWVLGWRDVCRATDARTVITTMGPRVAYGHKWLIALAHPTARYDIQSIWSSFVFDYVCRQKIGGTSLTYTTMSQLPIPRPEMLDTLSCELPDQRGAWVRRKVSALNTWDPVPESREKVRAELDAYVAFVYGISRSELGHILGTFETVMRKDISQHGSLRTKKLIMSAFDAMVTANENGATYESPWDEEVTS